MRRPGVRSSPAPPDSRADSARHQPGTLSGCNVQKNPTVFALRGMALALACACWQCLPDSCRHRSGSRLHRRQPQPPHPLQIARHHPHPSRPQRPLNWCSGWIPSAVACWQSTSICASRRRTWPVSRLPCRARPARQGPCMGRRRSGRSAADGSRGACGNGSEAAQS